MKTTILTLTASVLLTAAATAAIVTLPATGWTNDVVMNPSTPYSETVNGTLDGGPGNFEGYTFGEAGTYFLQPDSAPITVSGLTGSVYTSATGSGAAFQFQSFTQSNAVLLTGPTGSQPTGTLTLETPTSLTTLALYGTTSGGSTSASVTLNFSDSTTSIYTVASDTGIGRDWFSGNADARALVVGDRVSNRSEDGYTNVFYQQNSAISIHESLFVLSAEDQAKTIDSITLANTGGGRLAIFAISGEVVPEPSILGFLALTGLLARRRLAS